MVVYTCVYCAIQRTNRLAFANHYVLRHGMQLLPHRIDPLPMRADLARAEQERIRAGFARRNARYALNLQRRGISNSRSGEGTASQTVQSQVQTPSPRTASGATTSKGRGGLCGTPSHRGDLRSKITGRR